MNEVLKRPAPKIEPNGRSAVDTESDCPAIIAVRTSGAPLANARKVTPANVGDISKVSIISTEFINEFLYSCSEIIVIDIIDDTK